MASRRPPGRKNDGVKKIPRNRSCKDAIKIDPGELLDASGGEQKFAGSGQGASRKVLGPFFSVLSRPRGDFGLHLVCAVVTDEFLEFSAAQGNDLSTPNPMAAFPGLKAGDRWCLCVQRWKEALEHGVAPGVNLAATHISALEFVNLDELQQYAV